MRAAGIHHVSINVTDVVAACAFYSDVLGLSVRTDRPGLAVGGAWLDAGGQQVHLICAAVPSHGGQHFALLIDDLDGAVTELRSGGHRVSDPAAIGTGRQSFLTDPDGNLVELHQPAMSPAPA